VIGKMPAVRTHPAAAFARRGSALLAETNSHAAGYAHAGSSVMDCARRDGIENQNER
jgi:hypothetical protein